MEMSTEEFLFSKIFEINARKDIAYYSILQSFCPECNIEKYIKHLIESNKIKEVAIKVGKKYVSAYVPI
jgi:hypothetical protein